MRRLSIELTAEQHHAIKSMATLQGLSIRDYVLKHTMPNIPKKALLKKAPMTEAQALASLEQFLAPRIKNAKKGKVSKRSIDDILNDVIKSSR